MMDDGCWVVLISKGNSLLFPPEIYQSTSEAERELFRWREGVAKLEFSRSHRSASRSLGVTVEAVLLPASTATAWIGVCWAANGAATDLTGLPTRQAAISWLGVQAVALACDDISYGATRLTAAVANQILPRVESVLAKSVSLSMKG